MKRFLTGALLSALVTVSGAMAVRAETPGMPPPANRWALLVSIEDYPPVGPAENLPGCDLDANRLTKVLETKYGFPSANITRVKDMDATKARIVKELTDLADRAKPGDAVVFYYSGHGAQAPDLDGDEDDGWDEAIVPAEPVKGGTTEQRVARLLLDDEIAALTRRFKTKNVTMIFDSCHSGTVTADDPDNKLKAPIPTPPGLFSSKSKDLGWSREDRAKAGSKAVPGQAKTDDGMGDEAGGMVVLSASQPWETSGCTDEGGFFTNILVKALEVEDSLDWANVFSVIAPIVQERNPKQTPRVDGNVRSLPFSSAVSPLKADYARPTVAVVGAIPADTADSASRWKATGKASADLALVEGYQSLYLEQTGAIYDVYPESDKLMTGTPKGRVRITGEQSDATIYDRNGKPVRDDRFSTAQILSGEVAFGDRLALVAGAVPSEKPIVLIFIPSNLPDAVKEKMLDGGRAIYAAMKDNPALDVRLSGKIGEVDYIVQPVPSKTSEFETVIWSRGGLYLQNVEGDDAGEMATKLRQRLLDRHSSRTRLVRLHNASPLFGMRAYMPDGHTRRDPGSTVTVKVETDEPVYVTALTLDSAGNPIVVNRSEKAVGGDSDYTFSMPVPSGLTELRHPVKVIATRKPLELPDFSSLGASQRVSAVAAAIRKQVGDSGAGEGFLSAEGWADATLLIAAAK